MYENIYTSKNFYKENSVYVIHRQNNYAIHLPIPYKLWCDVAALGTVEHHENTHNRLLVEFQDFPTFHQYCIQHGIQIYFINIFTQ